MGVADNALRLARAGARACAPNAHWPALQPAHCCGDAHLNEQSDERAPGGWTDALLPVTRAAAPSAALIPYLPAAAVWKLRLRSLPASSSHSPGTCSLKHQTRVRALLPEPSLHGAAAGRLSHRTATEGPLFRGEEGWETAKRETCPSTRGQAERDPGTGPELSPPSLASHTRAAKPRGRETRLRTGRSTHGPAWGRPVPSSPGADAGSHGARPWPIHSARGRVEPSRRSIHVADTC